MNKNYYYNPKNNHKDQEKTSKKPNIIQTGVIYYILANVICGITIALTCFRLVVGTKSFEMMFSIGCDSLGVCVLSFMIHSCLRNKVYNQNNIDSDKKFERFLFCVVLAIFCNLVYWLVDGYERHLLIAINYICNIAFNMLTMLSVYLLVDYYKDKQWIKLNIVKLYQLAFWICFAVLGLSFIINFFAPVFFDFDHGCLIRTEVSTVFYVIESLFYVGILFIVRFKEMNNRQKYLMFYYVLMPFISVILQNIIMDVAIFCCGMVISTTIIFVLEYNVKQFQLIETERELASNRSILMLSQIQPHFVYNILSTISYLCKEDPDQAQELVSKFAKYLRNNVDFKSQDNLISFSKELESIQNYIDIEKIRFGDKLDVTYEIGVMDFTLPMLTLQPIVENAVKHGVLKRKEGGSIVISTFEDDLYYHLLVKDNGVGFDINEIKNDGKIHVGLKNVEERVKNISHGNILIESVIGRGTNILINIPKRKEV